MFRLLPLLLIPLLLLSCNGGKTAVDQATEDGILIVGNSSEPKGLDPHLVSGVLESNIIRALFEGLCAEDPKVDNQSHPGAATRWESNDDFTQWTFYLQPTAEWSDGVPVTARDFTFAYERLLTPTLPADYAEMLYFIKGAEDFHKRKTTDFSTVGVKALDDFTLQVTLRGPIPFLPEITKHYTWYPVPRHKILAHGRIDTPFTNWTDAGELVSNGPFQLKTWRTNHLIELERNPHYWDKTNVNLNGIRYLPVTNPYTEARMFLDGQLHLTYTLPPEMIAYAKEHLPEQLRQEPYVGVRFIRCNTLKAPLDNPKVRQALGAALDRQALITNILQGGQKPATGMTPPFGDYHPPADIHFDLEKAKQLLKDSGYQNTSDFPDIEFLTTTTDSARRIAEAMQEMWSKNLGINVRIVQREWSSYQQLQAEGDFHLAAAGWIGDYLDPTTFLEMWIKDGGNNKTGWHDDQYQNLLTQAENTSDPTQRFNLLAQAEAILLRDLPVIPNYWYTTNYLLSPHVKNYHPLLLNNHPFKHIKLEK